MNRIEYANDIGVRLVDFIDLYMNENVQKMRNDGFDIKAQHIIIDLSITFARLAIMERAIKAGVIQ